MHTAPGALCAGVKTGCGTASLPISNPLSTVPLLVVQYTTLPTAGTGAIWIVPRLPIQGPPVSTPLVTTALRTETWMGALTPVVVMAFHARACSVYAACVV